MNNNDYKLMINYIVEKDSFNAAVHEYNLHGHSISELISKYITSCVIRHSNLTNNIFYELIEIMDDCIHNQYGKLGFINVVCLFDIYIRYGNVIDVNKIIKYKYVLRSLLVNNEVCTIKLFDNDQLKTIFDVYITWLLKSTQRSLFKHIAILKIFKQYVGHKELYFLVGRALSDYKLAFVVQHNFNNNLSNKQKKLIDAINLLNNFLK